MLEEIEGVVNALPLPNEAPPVAAANQFTVPVEAVAPSVTVPVPQRLVGAEAVIVGMALIVATTEVRDAVVQPEFVASTK